jgi:hypothetical protein
MIVREHSAAVSAVINTLLTWIVVLAVSIGPS